MPVRKLSRAEIDEFLRGQRIARLGCHAGGVTYVVPLIYAYDEDAVVAVTTEGRKTAMLRENPQICVEVDEYDADGKGSWRSVIAQVVHRDLNPDPVSGQILKRNIRSFHAEFSFIPGTDVEFRPFFHDNHSITFQRSH